MSFAYMFKLIIIGDTGVGKSCLLLQFMDHRFRQKHQVTIGVQFGAKVVDVQGQDIKLQIWDTAGQQSFKSITRGYYRSAAGAILVYDVTNRESFNNVARWLQQAKLNGNSEMCFVLVGNKCDMESQRKVAPQQGANFAKQHGLYFMQVSAKTGYNVQQSFKKNAFLLVEKIQKGIIDTKNQCPGVKVGNAAIQKPLKLDTKTLSSSDNQKKDKKKGCC